MPGIRVGRSTLVVVVHVIDGHVSHVMMCDVVECGMRWTYELLLCFLIPDTCDPGSW
jgi:hypothetical protein